MTLLKLSQKVGAISDRTPETRGSSLVAGGSDHTLPYAGEKTAAMERGMPEGSVLKHAMYAAFDDELQKIAQVAQEKPSMWRRLRKAGPAIGTALGAGYAISRKRPLRSWAAPVFAGTSLGWLPDVAASGVEAARGK